MAANTSLVHANIANLLVALQLSMTAGGCASHAVLDPLDATPPPAVYHLHLPGIGGDNPIERWWCAQIEQSFAERADVSLRNGARSDLYDWTGPGGPMRALANYDANRAEAVALAERLASWRRTHPRTRLILTAASGGTGPAVWALEALPPDVQVDELILVSPALSPQYDLSRALARVRGRAHVFTSARDSIILGWGTTTYGTIDRRHVEAAGRFGFVAPLDADPDQYVKLVQVPYKSEWIRYWNFGGHAEAMSPSFGKHVIAPLLRG